MEEALKILEERVTKPNYLPILLLGAGFSLGAMNGDDKPLVLGKSLAKELYDNILEPNISSIEDYDEDKDKDRVDQAVSNGDLKIICQKLREFNLLNERNAYLTNRLKNCHWNDNADFDALTAYPWPYIFTLNIDDLIENIYSKNNKELVVWTDATSTYDENPNCTILIKLHGDVGNERDYIFDEFEYHNFISKEPRILTKFADEYVSRDLIILGTQFQEDDLKIVLKKFFNEKCISSNFHYFFISPNKFNRAIRSQIETNDNFHYIEMDNLEFLKNLRNWRIKDDSKNKLLLSNSFADWNKEFNESRTLSKGYDLYYGSSPVARDFFYQVDIPRRAERKKSNKERILQRCRIF